MGLRCWRKPSQQIEALPITWTYSQENKWRGGRGLPPHKGGSSAQNSEEWQAFPHGTPWKVSYLLVPAQALGCSIWRGLSVGISATGQGDSMKWRCLWSRMSPHRSSLGPGWWWGFDPSPKRDICTRWCHLLETLKLDPEKTQKVRYFPLLDCFTRHDPDWYSHDVVYSAWLIYLLQNELSPWAESENLRNVAEQWANNGVSKSWWSIYLSSLLYSF